MPPAGIKTETPTATPTYLWTNRGWYISFKRKDYSSFEDDGSSLRSSIRFHPFSWRIHHGMIPFFTWSTKTHSPTNSNWWGGELHQVLRSYWSGPTKAMITLDCWWCWCRIQSPWCSLLFFFGSRETRWRFWVVRLGWDRWSFGKKTQFLPLFAEKWYVTWPKISDLEAIGIHTHNSHPVKIRLVIWHPRGEHLLLARRSCAKQDQHFKNLC